MGIYSAFMLWIIANEIIVAAALEAAFPLSRRR